MIEILTWVAIFLLFGYLITFLLYANDRIETALEIFVATVCWPVFVMIFAAAYLVRFRKWLFKEKK